MSPSLRPLSSRPFVRLFAAALLSAAAGCGGSTVADNSGTGASGTGGAGAGGSAVCQADPPGAAFTFHVHNGGTQMLSLAYGCSASLPIVLDTPKGMLAISPGPADTCEFSCDDVFAGKTGQACSDCGPGYGADLGPGVTVDIPWDHRVYTEITVDPSCKGASTSSCALGEAIAGSAMQKGTLTVCTSNVTGPGGAGGYCLTSETVSFTVDTTQSSATVEVM